MNTDQGQYILDCILPVYGLCVACCRCAVYVNPVVSGIVTSCVCYCNVIYLHPFQGMWPQHQSILHECLGAGSLQPCSGRIWLSWPFAVCLALRFQQIEGDIFFFLFNAALLRNQICVWYSLSASLLYASFIRLCLQCTCLAVSKRWLALGSSGGGLNLIQKDGWKQRLFLTHKVHTWGSLFWGSMWGLKEIYCRHIVCHSTLTLPK